MYFSADKEIMDSNEHVCAKDLNLSNDQIYGRKLRPLVPGPIRATTKSSFFPTLQNSPRFFIHNPNILSWKHPLIGDRNSCSDNRGMMKTTPLVSTRWNPTPEQLQALEEMYRRGTRTPSAEQIQQIAAKLRRFGKIEGKNVFYWFQNHKARERQKKRRQLELLAAGKKTRHAQNQLEIKPAGLSRRYFDIEHPKKLATPSSCSTLSEGAECNKKELQQQVITRGKNETCWKLELSSCIHPNNSTAHPITAQRSRGQENADHPFGGLDHTILLPSKNNDFRIIESGIKESQTLQLFPIKGIDMEDIDQDDVSMGGTKFAPNEFIEFLPTRN